MIDSQVRPIIDEVVMEIAGSYDTEALYGTCGRVSQGIQNKLRKVGIDTK